jgi:nicotinamide phosphoribosyltransferase
MTYNLILDVDSYKVSHFNQYPANTSHVYSYIESRGGKFDRTVFFGLQIFIKKYLMNPITREMIDEAEEFYQVHGEPFNRHGWEHILKHHNGFLPIHIKAVAEGSIIPTHNVLVTVENTDPKCFWLTSYVETALLRAVWYPTTVATLSWHAKQEILSALYKSSDDPKGQIGFKLHDFGARGVSSLESAGIGGAAHLVNFMGSDTVTGVWYANKYYNAKMAGFSIPAAEHSTITSWGRSHEADAYANMVNKFGKPGSLVAVVSDSYDLMNAVNNIWGDQLKQTVVNSGATVVVRPDSGDPTKIPLDVIDALGEKFGFTLNSHGYKVLHPSVRVIQGDGINLETIKTLSKDLLSRGWSADNLAYGMGGQLLQGINRDTQKFAMKCSAIMVNGEWRDVFKDPVTDPGKRSKRGRLMLTREPGSYTTLPVNSGFDYGNLLHTVFRDGKLMRDQPFDDVRANSDRTPLD